MSLPRPSEKEFLDIALRDCEDELVSSLSGVDPQELCDKFSERCLLSSESHAHFASLDHSRLKSQLQVRYLVRLASERVKTDPALGHNFIELLDTLEGVHSSLTDKLKQAMADTNEGPTDDSDTVGGLTATAVREASEEKDIVLTRENVSLLTELLAKARDKWEEIATLLGLQDYERADCKGNSNLLSLARSIEFWISKDSKATLKKLANALSVVGKYDISEEVLKKFEQKQKVNSSSESKSSTRSSETPRIASQSLPIEVADGKSTLLQVQARPRESVVAYQWNKDGQPLANGSRYSGVDEDVLVVRHASQGTEGEYTCCVTFQVRQVTSIPITLTVDFPQAKSHLLKRYSYMKVPTSKNDWPPVVSKTFINLALVESTNTVNFAVQGDADDMVKKRKVESEGDADDIEQKKKKIKVEYEDVFREYRSEELILVEGRPGSGKTTLVHKIVKDWASSGEILCNSKLVFLVKLRLLDLDTSLANILCGFYSVEKLRSVVADIEGRGGDGVCFVFDGLDEYLSPNEEESYIHKLLDRSVLLKCMIIVSSRPSATKQVHKDHITKRVEVFGFSKEQISEYVDSFPFDEEGGTIVSSITRARQLKKYLLDHRNLHDMCYLPIHAAMICFLFQYDENISSTQTNVYKEFTRLIIHRHLARNLKKHAARRALRSAVRSLDNLDKPHAESFKNLCCLAYEMTLKSIQVICSQKLPAQLGGSGSLSEEEGLGLLTICPTLQQTGFHQSYAFLHLTFQEFLTAYYIANYMDDSQQMDILQKYRGMKTVWLFYSGLVDFEKAPEKLDALIQRGLKLFNYAFESQQKIFCDGVVKVNNGMLDFIDLMTPTDFLSVGYVIKTSSHPIIELSIESYFDQHDDDRNFLVLSQLQDSNLSQLKVLKFCSLIFNADTESLCEVLKNAKNIQRLELKFNHKDSHYSELLACQISQCTDLHRLRLSCNGSPECFQTFFSSLKVPQTSVHLYLNDLDAQCFEALSCGPHAEHLYVEVEYCNITKHGMKCLLVCLQNIKEIKMDFCENKFSSDGLAGLVEISDTIQVEVLNLSRNNIGSDCAAGLAGLKCMSGLKELYVSQNNIGPGGAAALGCGLKHLTGLGSLSLNYNNFGLDGTAALASELKYVTGLTCLELCNNNIGDEGAAALASELKYVTGLIDLRLSNNNIGDDGAIALSHGLTGHSKLTRLDFSGNSVDVTAVKAIIRLLRECKYLWNLKFDGINISIANNDYCFDETGHLITPENCVAISELLKTEGYKCKHTNALFPI